MKDHEGALVKALIAHLKGDGALKALLGDPALVAAGWARLGAKIPQEPAVLVEWAELLVVARGGFDAESTALLERALALAPDEPKALAMGGAAAAAAGEHAKAVERWERLLAQALTRDDAVALEDPCFLASIQVTRFGGYRAVAVPVDDEGMTVDGASRWQGMGR